MVKWRIAKEFAFHNLLIVHSFIVVSTDVFEDGVKRIEGLNDYPAFFLASSCPSGKLGQQREAAFVRSEIRIVQHTVRIYYSHQAYIGKIKTLAHKLSAA